LDGAGEQFTFSKYKSQQSIENANCEIEEKIICSKYDIKNSFSTQSFCATKTNGKLIFNIAKKVFLPGVFF